MILKVPRISIKRPTGVRATYMINTLKEDLLVAPCAITRISHFAGIPALLEYLRIRLFCV